MVWAIAVGWAILSGNQISFFPAGCPLKSFTGLPCPGCGTTHGWIHFLEGNYEKAFYANPVGMFMILISFPAGVLLWYDVFTKHNHLYKGYVFLENQWRNPLFTGGILIVIGGNWIWNIIK